MTLTGTNHTAPSPNDSATQIAKADLTTAYNDAAGQTPTQVATELSGQTLTAGTYSSASGTFGMNGTLVLDGQNNSDAVFIFQTSTTFVTGSTANVSLINGAQACNVFWQVGSAASLGAGSVLQGTVLAHDNISVGAAVTVDGRLFAGEQSSGAGAVTLIGDTIQPPTTCLASTPSSSTTTTTASTTTTSTTLAPASTTTTNVPSSTDGANARAARERAARDRARRIRSLRRRTARIEAAKLAAQKAAAAAAMQQMDRAKLNVGFARPPIHQGGFTG